MSDQIRAFTSSSEFMMWNEANCCQCRKDFQCDMDGNNTVTSCDIEEAIAFSAISAGVISHDTATRAGLVDGCGYGQTCTEIEPKETE